ncbi:MAG: acetyl-CoA acetyltransferase [Bryobacteraceae bacterium]|nr:MAG: acetyl-CoA acetyltransferase [Bryobacteraceae bacterium]
MKKIYIAAYHQSKFGKLMGMTVPEILRAAVEGACREIHAEPAALDVASVGAACNQSLNEQGLLAGLVAEAGGLEGKMIESVENACASGGQAVLSVTWKLQLGFGETGIAIGYEKMRGPDGKADGKLVGKALGYYSHPDERPGKTFVFPHIFAEIMQQYMAEYGVTEEDLARIAVEEYACAQHNPYAQMQGVALTLEQALRIEGVNRYVVEGLPLKTYDCSQITDGYAALILATEEGLARLGVRRQDCVELAGYGQATDRLGRAGRDVLRPRGAQRAMQQAYQMAGISPADVNVAEIHDCFTVMGAIGTEVIGMAEPGAGTRFWRDGQARVGGRCAINSSGGLIAKGHPVGATGVAMIGWCYWQLTGRAPAALQVASPRAAATFNIGGPVCASVCTVLRPAA